jgi:CRISPR type I-A-associated protein Csa5
MSSEAVSKGIYEALRNFDSLNRRNLITIVSDGIIVRKTGEEGEKEFFIGGKLPSGDDIDKFLEYSRGDPTLARDVAAIAMGKIIKSVRR